MDIASLAAWNSVTWDLRLFVLWVSLGQLQFVTLSLSLLAFRYYLEVTLGVKRRKTLFQVSGVGRFLPQGVRYKPFSLIFHLLLSWALEHNQIRVKKIYASDCLLSSWMKKQFLVPEKPGHSPTDVSLEVSSSKVEIIRKTWISFSNTHKTPSQVLGAETITGLPSPYGIFGAARDSWANKESLWFYVILLCV